MVWGNRVDMRRTRRGVQELLVHARGGMAVGTKGYSSVDTGEEKSKRSRSYVHATKMGER